MEDRTAGPGAGAPDRRTVLTGGSAAALGVSSFLLPAAAAATSPGAEGAATGFRVLASSSYSTLQASSPNGSAPLFRSFEYADNRYLVDLVNGKLVCFNAAGTWIETVAIPDAPLGFDDPLNQDSATLFADNLTSFLVVGDAACAAYTIRTFSPAIRLVRVMRLTLSVSPGATSGMVHHDGELQFLVSSSDLSSVRQLERIVVPIGADWATAMSRDSLLSGSTVPSRFNQYDAVAVPPSAPTQALFLGDSDDPCRRVPLTGTPSVTSLSIVVPAEVQPPSYSFEYRYGTDRYAVQDGNVLHLATTAYVGGVDRAALLRFDLSTADTDTQLTATALTLATGGAGYACAVARTSATIYVAIADGYNFGNPGATVWRENGYLARFSTAGGTLTWQATATVGISATPPWHYPLTVQAVSTGALSGGVGGAAVGGQGAASAPVVVLVGE